MSLLETIYLALFMASEIQTCIRANHKARPFLFDSADCLPHIELSVLHMACLACELKVSKSLDNRAEKHSMFPALLSMVRVRWTGSLTPLRHTGDIHPFIIGYSHARQTQPQFTVTAVLLRLHAPAPTSSVEVTPPFFLSLFQLATFPECTVTSTAFPSTDPDELGTSDIVTIYGSTERRSCWCFIRS